MTQNLLEQLCNPYQSPRTSASNQLYRNAPKMHAATWQLPTKNITVAGSFAQTRHHFSSENILKKNVVPKSHTPSQPSWQYSWNLHIRRHRVYRYAEHTACVCVCVQEGCNLFDILLVLCFLESLKRAASSHTHIVLSDRWGCSFKVWLDATGCSEVSPIHCSSWEQTYSSLWQGI